MKEVTICLNEAKNLKKFVNALSRYDFDVDAMSLNRRYNIDAKSIMGLYALDISQPIILKIYDRGEDVSTFLEEIKEFEVEA